MLTFEYPKFNQKENQENIESILTETPINESQITAPKGSSTRITQLKLRSNSKKSHQKEIESIIHSRKRKSIQDITNYPSRIGTFHI